MAQLFKPVKKVKIFEDIVHQLQASIFSGELTVGEKLPSEKDLQNRFQTSQPAVREAIRIMEYQGLVRTGTGKNRDVFVASTHCDTLGDNFSLLMRSQRFSLDDLAEFREKIEGETVALAAAQVTDLDIFQLQALIEEAERYSRKSRKSVKKFINNQY